MKKILLIILVLLICACGKNEKNELDKVLEKGNYLILDVRTKEEYDIEHVKGSINIPYDQIENNLEGETFLDINKTIIVYCRSGRRSGIAREVLEKNGFKVLDLGAYDSISLEKEK